MRVESASKMDSQNEIEDLFVYQHTQELLGLSSDVEKRKRTRGSTLSWKRDTVDWNHEAAAKQLYKKYVERTPLCGQEIFSNKYRVSRKVFSSIFDAIASGHGFFKQNLLASGRIVKVFTLF